MWMFNCGDTFSGNPKWLFIYVQKFRPDITAYWLCETEQTAAYVRSLGYRALTFKDPEAPRIQAKTGVYVVNQVKEYIPDELRGAVFLNVWHGVGVKGIERAMNKGYLEERIAKKYIRYNKLYRDNQLFLVTSKMMEEHFIRQIGLDDDTIIRGGYPQNIYPKEIGGYASYDHDVLTRRGLPEGTRVAVYAATPRRSSTPDFLRRALPDMDRLVAQLEATNTLLILKMHPHMGKDRYFAQLREAYGHHPYLMFWDNSEDIYEIFPRIDLAIMDYSSILYDLLAAGVQNFVRYIFDYEESGSEVVTGEFDYLDLSCGTVTKSFDELLAALEHDNRVDTAELSRLEEAFWGYSSPDSLGHIVDAALKFKIRDLDLPTLHTFDVFDTLIHRRGVTPGSVFHYVRSRIENSDLAFPAFLREQYPEIRQQAEAAMRDRRRRQRDMVQEALLEITFEEIHQRLATLFDLSPEQSEALQQWEIEGELASVIPDTAMIDRLEQLHRDGATVALVSDMYLPRETVTALLERADPRLTNYPLYLSSDTREQKTTKSLYLKVYREVGYDFAEWIHHGDSPAGDVRAAESMAIIPDPVPRTEFNRFENEIMRDFLSWEGHLYAAMLRDFRRERSDDQDQSTLSSQEEFAFNHVAAYLVPYVDWALSDAIRRGYRTVYFVSRDGHHLKRIADVLVAERGLDVRTRYIYGSRSAWRLASQIDELDPDLFQPHGDFFHARTVDALLSSARLSAGEFHAMFPEFQGLTDADLTDEPTRETVLAALSGSAEFREHLLRTAAAERDLAVRYLQQEIDFDEPLAFIEYWGSGYTQDCLARLMVEAAGRPIDTPFYYARAVRPSEGHAVRHMFTNATYSMIFVEAVFANHPHSTTLGYEEADGRIRAVTQPRSYQVQLFDAMEELLPEFARRYSQLPVLDRDRLARGAFRSGFRYRGRHPKEKVFIRNLAPLKDAVGVGAEEVEFAPGMTRSDLKAHLRGESFSSRTQSMPMTLARSTEWVRVNYNLRAEPKGKTSTPRKVALLGRAFVRTGYRSVNNRVRTRWGGADRSKEQR
ncbi:CDP-glycerol glycerophosphotransferase (TagB/SpsB family)/FMN phosphatase YigB (HAD superfamily) [Flexivirga oryzae]|uniref:CDP-glycerol glycerophosphotransferase (TagB/SpsB family)/FMN phosphatase YigB (HAD superfamily) n=1 Tax=Flexivirga oryzae TaxID=1794944 RepID=A0A839N0T8_9MICO|nr:CDP-glycerol glycerophosphotransferase (TagB/SpsB family)/FMN phosphatase YigB (HAD superfamily) [Flexivirga oryzae]